MEEENSHEHERAWAQIGDEVDALGGAPSLEAEGE